MRERPHAHSRRPARHVWLLLVEPCRPGDVHVRPRRLFGELLQEIGGRDRSGLAPPHILEIGDLALELLAILGIQGHRPELLPGLAPGGDQLLDQRSIIAEDGRIDRPEGDHAGSGERGQVHDLLRPEPTRIGDRIGQDEASLGIRIDHLDGLAAQRAHDIPRLLRAPARHVLGRRHEAKHLDPGSQLRDRAHGAEHSRSPRHVVLHLLHPLSRLERNTSGIEGDPLAEQRDRRQTTQQGLIPLGDIPQDDQTGRLIASASHAQERPHAQLLHPMLIEHLDVQTVSRGHILRPTRQLHRREHARGFVDEIAREVRRLGQDRAALDPPLQLRLGFPLGDQTHFFDRPLLFLLRLVGARIEEREQHALDGRLRARAQIERGAPQEGHRADSPLPQKSRRRARYTTDGIRGEVGSLPRPHKEDARGRQRAHRGHVERLAEFPLHLTGRERRREHAAQAPIQLAQQVIFKCVLFEEADAEGLDINLEELPKVRLDAHITSGTPSRWPASPARSPCGAQPPAYRAACARAPTRSRISPAHSSDSIGSE
ncbi:hypothetical protein HRbin10_02734 [bacterium HR10]|nr:hypothetical protein HRbin10_02734 [bacterium HR10]